MEKAAVIKTGSKQYLVREGDIIDVELLESGEKGKAIEFNEVLYLKDGKGVKVGSPFVSNAIVKGEIVDIIRGPKVIAYKYKKRKNYRRKVGHRQNYNRVKIVSVAV